MPNTTDVTSSPGKDDKSVGAGSPLSSAFQFIDQNSYHGFHNGANTLPLLVTPHGTFAASGEMPFSLQLRDQQLDLTEMPFKDLVQILQNEHPIMQQAAVHALSASLHTLKPKQLLELNAISHANPHLRELLSEMSFQNQTRVVSARVILFNPDNQHEVILREGESGDWSLPGGKIGITGKKKNRRIETALEAIYREGAEEVGENVFQSLKKVEKKAQPFTVLITPKDRWLKDKAELVGLDTEDFKSLGKKRWEVTNPWTQVFVMPHPGKFKETVQEGRTVQVVNIQKLDELVDIRPAHRELLWKYRLNIKDGVPTSPFTVYSAKKER
jgi:ADP-ribose pyrophosphatase YjhB (NUDIX family)